jgi:hypothetical protein
MPRFPLLLPVALLAFGILACSPNDPLEIPAEAPPGGTDLVLLGTSTSTSTRTPTALPTHTHTPVPPTNTPTPSATPTDSPTPDLTATALVDACLDEFEDLKECLNDIALGHIFDDVLPDHRIVDNADPTTLYRNEAVLTLLGADGAILRHNYYTRPENCPTTLACVLHVLVIKFPSQEAALEFFDLVAGDGTGMPEETIIPVPNAEVWDDSKCATGTRPSAEGAPPFAVIYCSVSLGSVHFGFNLSSYEDLPDGFVDVLLLILLTAIHQALETAQM